MPKEKRERMDDIVPKIPDVDEKINIDSILDRDMMFISFQDLTGKYGDFLFVIVTEVGESRTLGFSTGSEVVCRKLKFARDKGKLPILGKLVKPDRYYDII